MMKENEILHAIKDILINLKSVQKKESSSMFNLACSYKKCLDEMMRNAKFSDELTEFDANQDNSQADQDVRQIIIFQDQNDRLQHQEAFEKHKMDIKKCQ